MGKNIVIFANIIDDEGKNNFEKRPIAKKTYRFLRQEAWKRKIPIQRLFTAVLEKAYQKNKKGYLSLSFVKDYLK